MRFYELLNFQHVMLYLFPALIFILVFGLFLGFTHFRGKDSERRKTAIIERFPGGIEGRDAPFPLAMTLTIAGTVIWGFLYIWFTGILEVTI